MPGYACAKDGAKIGAISNILASQAMRGKPQTKKKLTLNRVQKFAMDLSPLLEKEFQKINEKRNAGFYVNYKDEKWCSPFDIPRERARSLIDFGKQGLVEIVFRCNILIDFAPFQNELYFKLESGLKKALDERRISQELYDAISSSLKDYFTSAKRKVRGYLADNNYSSITSINTNTYEKKSQNQ